MNPKIAKSKWNYTIVISHCEGNLTSTISYLFVMLALLNTSLLLALQITCQTLSKTTFVWISPKCCRKNAMECVQCFLPRNDVKYINFDITEPYVIKLGTYIMHNFPLYYI